MSDRLDLYKIDGLRPFGDLFVVGCRDARRAAKHPTPSRKQNIHHGHCCGIRSETVATEALHFDIEESYG